MNVLIHCGIPTRTNIISCMHSCRLPSCLTHVFASGAGALLVKPRVFKRRHYFGEKKKGRSEYVHACACLCVRVRHICVHMHVCARVLCVRVCAPQGARCDYFGFVLFRTRNTIDTGISCSEWYVARLFEAACGIPGLPYTV